MVWYSTASTGLDSTEFILIKKLAQNSPDEGKNATNGKLK